MPEFQREERYIVVKIKDLQEGQADGLRALLAMNDVPTRECVVVEADWPIYEDVWAMVQRLVEGRPQKTDDLKEQLVDEARNVDEANAELRKVREEKDALAAQVDEAKELVREWIENPQTTAATWNLARRLGKWAMGSRRVDGDLDQLALDTARAIADIDSTTLPGGYTQALAKAQCLIRDALRKR